MGGGGGGARARLASAGDETPECGEVAAATGEAVAPRRIPREQLRQNGSADALWVAIHGTVYDLTAFADRHPGGAEILYEVAGADASEMFESAGHSERARGAFRAPCTPPQRRRAARLCCVLGHGRRWEVGGGRWLAADGRPAEMLPALALGVMERG